MSEKILEVERKLNRRHKVILEYYKHNDKISVKEFIKEFFNYYNHYYRMVYTTSGNIQCKIGARRSVGDVYKLCKSYYPNVTLKEVMETLLNLTESGEIGNFWCGIIKKRVFRKGLFTAWNIGGRGQHEMADENGFKEADYKSLKK